MALQVRTNSNNRDFGASSRLADRLNDENLQVADRSNAANLRRQIIAQQAVIERQESDIESQEDLIAFEQDRRNGTWNRYRYFGNSDGERRKYSPSRVWDWTIYIKKTGIFIISCIRLHETLKYFLCSTQFETQEPPS